MKLYYWSPFFSNVATEKAVINSVEAVNKFSKKKINAYLLDVIGEWHDRKIELSDRNIFIKDLLSFKLIKFLPKYGFVKSRFSYLIVFFFSTLVRLSVTARKIGIAPMGLIIANNPIKSFKYSFQVAMAIS